MQSRGYKAFSLPEVFMGVLVMGVLFGVMLLGFVTLQRTLLPRQALVGEQAVPVAPTFAPVATAMALNRTLLDRVGEASAVYVLGGVHPGLPAGCLVSAQHPLAASALPVGNLSSLALDARAFYQANSAVLGDMLPDPHSEDFSIVVVGQRTGVSKVICLVQVTREQIQADVGAGQSVFVYRMVRLWDIDGATLSYAFLEREGAGVFVGAVHTWLRYQESSVFEEGPATVALPDPWVYAGARGRPDDIPAFSRFIYSFPVSR